MDPMQINVLEELDFYERNPRVVAWLEGFKALQRRWAEYIADELGPRTVL